MGHATVLDEIHGAQRLASRVIDDMSTRGIGPSNPDYFDEAARLLGGPAGPEADAAFWIIHGWIMCQVERCGDHP